MANQRICILVNSSLQGLWRVTKINWNVGFMSEHVLTDNLSVPKADGACDHLAGMLFPSLTFESTNGFVVLPELPETTVLYIYPRSSADAADHVGWADILGHVATLRRAVLLEIINRNF